MKYRIAAFAIAIMLAISLPITASANVAWYKVTYQLDNLSDEDIVKLLEYVNKEIDGRESITKKVLVNPGQYTVGIDIPAGTYSICDVKGKSYPSISFVVYSKEGEKMYSRDVPTDGQVDNVALRNGQIILIIGNCVYFKPYIGLKFWD